MILLPSNRRKTGAGTALIRVPYRSYPGGTRSQVSMIAAEKAACKNSALGIIGGEKNHRHEMRNVNEPDQRKDRTYQSAAVHRARCGAQGQNRTPTSTSRFVFLDRDAVAQLVDRGGKDSLLTAVGTRRARRDERCVIPGVAACRCLRPFHAEPP